MKATFGWRMVALEFDLKSSFAANRM